MLYDLYQAFPATDAFQRKSRRCPETVSAAELERMRASDTPFTILDVRRQIDFEADDEMIPGARHADPAVIDDWSQTLDPQEALVIYCVKGGTGTAKDSA